MEFAEIGSGEDHPVEECLELDAVDAADIGDLALVAESGGLFDQEVAQRNGVPPAQHRTQSYGVVAVGGSHAPYTTPNEAARVGTVAAIEHEWDLDPARARALQRELAGGVIREDRFESIETIAGLDLGFPRPDIGRAALVVLRLPALEVVDRRVVERPVSFPYVPGLLSFREAPVGLAAFAELERRPDLLMVDGQGLAHPRRFGIACHLGLLLDLPTIGCAKSILVGRGEAPGPERGDRAPLVDRGETVGVALRTRARVKPVYVSIGHRVSLETAIELTLRCGRGYRLPEPTRLANQAASRRRPDTAP